jgi:dihydropteroate synthase
MVAEGADLIDIGGESTRPGSGRVEIGEEIRRVVPVIEAIVGRFDIPVSVDTSKYDVAREALSAGAEIINDISGLRFDDRLAGLSAETGAGLVLMHSRGDFEAMHSQEPVSDVIVEVSTGLGLSLDAARAAGVTDEQIVLDPGIGFGKTPDQNLELLGKLDKLVDKFSSRPMLVGASRKSFIGRVLDGAPPLERISGSLSAAAIAVWNGALIIRAHDVRATRDAVRVAEAAKGWS